MPDPFYEMDFCEFLLMREGWNEKLLYEQAIAKKSAFIIAQALGVKLSVLEKAWPDPTKKEVNPMVKYKGVQMSKRQRDILVKLKLGKKKTNE